MVFGLKQMCFRGTKGITLTKKDASCDIKHQKNSATVSLIMFRNCLKCVFRYETPFKQRFTNFQCSYCIAKIYQPISEPSKKRITT